MEKKSNVNAAGIKRWALNVWYNYSVVVVFLFIVIICSFAAPKFFTINNFMTIFRGCATVGIIALGMTFVLITGGIDLSAGANFASCGLILIFLQGLQTIPLIFCVLIACLAGMAVGFINGTIISKAKIPPFIVTLAMQITIRSIVMYISKGSTVRGVKDIAFTNIGNGSLFGVPIPFLIFIALAILIHMLLSHTKFGTYVYALGGNETAARYTGVKVDSIRVAVYMLIGFLIGLASMVEVSRMASISSTVSGVDYELEAVTSAVVGGTSFAGGKGKIIGTVIGAILMSIISNMLIHLNVSVYLSGAVKGLVILTAVLMQRRDK